ncbi:MAG: hypothetical protein EZS28_008743 [Streblomastix strix]|uniref:Mariner mos1 transposase n=1 Tax=Streblomastix strix TaxID=222440 RepID=A0A5J4WLJ2_9EUKA|nr:MAG: hypothetical protein EZS28_008743 [Streblomastix strix]
MIQRVLFAKEKLKSVKVLDADGFKKFATGDETWLYFDNDQDAQWIKRREPRPERYRKLIGAPQVMLTVFFSGERILSAHQLPQKSNMNAEVFINDILIPLETKKNSIFNRIKHPPYSPDLSPCDYYLFGVLKSKLKGMHFTSADEGHEVAINILESIPSIQLLNALSAWATRLDYIIEHKGQNYNRK